MFATSLNEELQNITKTLNLMTVNASWEYNGFQLMSYSNESFGLICVLMLFHQYPTLGLMLNTDIYFVTWFILQA